MSLGGSFRRAARVPLALAGVCLRTRFLCFRAVRRPLKSTIKGQLIEDAPINLAVFVRVGPTEADFLKGEGQGGDIDGALSGDDAAVMRGSSELATSPAFDSAESSLVPKEQREQSPTLSSDVSVNQRNVNITQILT